MGPIYTGTMAQKRSTLLTWKARRNPLFPHIGDATLMHVTGLEIPSVVARTNAVKVHLCNPQSDERHTGKKKNEGYWTFDKRLTRHHPNYAPSDRLCSEGTALAKLSRYL